ncbi:hypothetical protein BJ138DRAFT_1180843 [Hygrophoropsis aurantiaca]|uniref:Uncharacterized protein n=1 Tax=Hygrophoropsis aurantiaca TaxID=72124 RepID=A0ACB8A8U9_9AGAM|nr:hypothetical protein BJ138DRAFT_1180843 [Hygrophoropsis aurantiaca]
MDVGQLKRALRSLPNPLRDRASKALNGSSREVQMLCTSLSSASTANYEAILPIFLLHLDSAAIPARIDQESKDIIMCARWALVGILKISNDDNTRTFGRGSEAQIVGPKWDILFPWMLFLHEHFVIRSSQLPDSMEGLSISDADVARTNISLVSSICKDRETARNLIFRSPAVVRMVVQMWNIFMDANGGNWDLSQSQGLGPMGAESSIRFEATIAMAYCVDFNDLDPATFNILLEAAGGAPRMVTTALKYIRLITEDLERTRITSLKARINLISVAFGFSHCMTLIWITSMHDAVVRELFITAGSIQKVIAAMDLLASRLLVKAGDSSDDHPRMGMEFRRGIISKGYGYIIHAIKAVNDGVSSLCLALDAGLLDVFLHTGAFVQQPKGFRLSDRLHNTDLELLKEISGYLVYVRVLETLAKSFDRIVSNDTASRGRRDRMLWEAWTAFQDVVQIRLDLKSDLDAVNHPLYSSKCTADSCRNADEKSTLHRCAGCLSNVYCSEECQRNHWKDDHRNSCKILRIGLKTSASRDIRRSLPLICLIESTQWVRERSQLGDLIEKARTRWPKDRDRLAVEMDMRTVPPTFSVHPMDNYSEILSHNCWTDIVGGLQQEQKRSKKNVLTIVKFENGNTLHTLFSPRVGLKWTCSWPPPELEYRFQLYSRSNECLGSESTGKIRL